MAMRRAVGLLGSQDDLAEGLGYTLKRRLLGRPLINEQLGEQRLSNPLALGVLAPDGISSSAYGTEEILIELLKGGLAVTAFTLILPLTGVVLFVMALVVLSYREVVTVYTRAGGSYVVARENFGPQVAQIAAVALLIDYVVTVAVQVAAGTAAVASAWRAIDNPTLITVISIVIVILMCYGNLRGIREAGRSFAVPTYLFSGVGDHHDHRRPDPRGVRDAAALSLAAARAGHRALEHQRPDRLRHGLRAAAGVRQRRLLADRHRGGLQRGQRVPPAGGRSTPAGCW